MIERLIRFVSAVSFHRGLALGAFVGAAIAGSTIWSRLRTPGRGTDADPATATVDQRDVDTAA